MMDFLLIATRSTKRGVIEIYPKFVIKKSSDLMIRGGDFYAIWVEERGLWSTDEQCAIQLIDQELDRYAEKHRHKFEGNVKVLHMWDAESGMIDNWHRYCQRQMRDNFHPLDERLIFSNQETTKTDYASKRLPYPLVPGECPGYETLMSKLYSPEERMKIEWAIGAIVTGDSKKIQKFIVLYGSMGTGKSTILNIIEQLFEGYYSVFDARALGSSSNSFALEAFRTNPLVAIQHDGDLSRIEDNTRLNSLVSHEAMTVNEKYKSTYTSRYQCFLFMGTNRPVKITDAKSGLIRRLIDVSPSGNKLNIRDYRKAVKQIKFELGAIACHCKDVYLNNKDIYDDYIPIAMLGASNDFYNFVSDSYLIFKDEDGVTLRSAWEMYKTYCEDAKVLYPHSQRVFKEELKNYFREHLDRYTLEDGSRVRNYYKGFITSKFDPPASDILKPVKKTILKLDQTKSLLDTERAECYAQYATPDEKPFQSWDSVKTKLSDIDTSRVHYVRLPENHIVIDFDIRDSSGNKCKNLNLEEASKWPPTYAEFSKSGNGVHLHYIYEGDTSMLSRVYDDDIEIKVAVGKSSLRRKLSKCNDIPIATINSGLPLRGEKKMVNFEGVKSEKGLRTLVVRNLNKEYHNNTAPSVSFIHKILEDAYNSDLKYDISDMRNRVLSFAADSSNQAEQCLKLVRDMKFKSEEPSIGVNNDDAPLTFFDVEVFPNLLLVNWKHRGDNPVVRMINPSSTEIEELMKFRLIGFNCRRYDNHILYARLMGYSNEQIYNLSKKIISGNRGAFFGEAYNVSYTDVYDFSSAGNKMGLKKWQIKLGLKHQELGLSWDDPVPEEQWIEVAEYCDNDVIATEAVFDHLSGDWVARQILADLAGMTVNDTTNTLSTRVIFGNNRKPQEHFNYRNLAEPVKSLTRAELEFLKETSPEMMSVKHGEERSLLPYFPGYTFEKGKSVYREQDVGEGGRVYAEPGFYGNVALLDVASQHPTSIINEVLFGVIFTKRFKELVYGRLDIKNEEWIELNDILEGKLTPYVQQVLDGKMTSKELGDALKTAINSVYGLTAAKFPNAFNDPRNIDNIVAKRGALFMVDLQFAVQERGFTVAHIKTDSIKIPDATPEIIDFVMEFGKLYGYTFDHEATYDKFCLVNDAVYVAKYATPEVCQDLYGYIPGDNKKKAGKWTATGKQFQVPFVFKTLFSKEPIEFEDLCEVMNVSTALYLDMNENLPDVSKYEKELAKLIKQDKHTQIQELDLEERIRQGHDYQFVGRIGQFSPIKEGRGGGVLLRAGNAPGKYGAAPGSKGYRWLESHMVKELGKENDIDQNYYEQLVVDAINTIDKYGDWEWLLSEDAYVPSKNRDVPPWIPPCGDRKYDTCQECPNFTDQEFDMDCKLGYDISGIIGIPWLLEKEFHIKKGEDNK